MNLFHFRPSVSSLLIFGGLALLLLEIGWLSHARVTAARAQGILEQKVRERDRLVSEVASPGSPDDQVLAATLIAGGTAVHELSAGLAGPAPAPAPEDSLDTFFALAAFVEQARDRLAAAGVRVRADERFGFATYAHAGPAPEALATIHQQWRGVAGVIDALADARPLALLGLKRERLDSRTDRTTDEVDFFTPDRQWAWGAPATTTTRAFRVEFTGATAVLRHFLNRLVARSETVAVRSVEVEALGPERGVTPHASHEVTLVRQAPSRFVVVVEFLIPAQAPAAAAP